MTHDTHAGGDVDLAAVGALVGDRARCRILLALDDGRALPASVLASEAGISAATASSHLGKLVDGGLLSMEAHGRHRYYRLAGPDVGDLVEVLARLAPPVEVRSLRQGTKAEQLRRARSCYDHLAGRLGVAVMGAFIDRAYVTGGDGRFDPERAVEDRLSARGRDVPYQLTAAGREWLGELGIESGPAGDPVRYCVDWSEQRHHLSGRLGRDLLETFVARDWIRRARTSRAVELTEDGHSALAERLDLDVDQPTTTLTQPLSTS